VRIRRVDLDRILAQGTTGHAEAHPGPFSAVEARDELVQALEPAHRLLGRRSAARRAELAEGLQELSDAVAAALRTRSTDSRDPTSNR
jgi:hypothetical protein